MTSRSTEVDENYNMYILGKEAHAALPHTTRKPGLKIFEARPKAKQSPIMGLAWLGSNRPGEEEK
jgi:hypothetical protein